MDELIATHSADIPDIIQAKRDAMEEIRLDQQRVIRNIKAASDFNWIRDGEHSNKQEGGSFRLLCWNLL